MRYRRTDRRLYPVLLGSQMRKAISSAADDRIDTVRATTPLGRTGRLRRSLEVQPGNYERIDGATRVTARIVALATNPRPRWRGYAYASAPEFGNRGQGAQRYLQRAARKINDRKGRRR